MLIPKLSDLSANRTESMNPLDFTHLRTAMSRRHFFGQSANGLGTAALASCVNPKLFAGSPSIQPEAVGAMPVLHHAPKAKRVIWMFMADGPSQLDLWD